MVAMVVPEAWPAKQSSKADQAFITYTRCRHAKGIANTSFSMLNVFSSVPQPPLGGRTLGLLVEVGFPSALGTL